MEGIESVTLTTPAVSPARSVDTSRRVLTHSSMDAWGRCETEYRLSYVECLAPSAYASALAVGSAVHAGVEALHRRHPLGAARLAAARVLRTFLERVRMGIVDDGAANLDQQVEFDAARVRAMLAVWHDRYFIPWNGSGTRQDRDLEVLETELVLRAPLRNPRTCRSSRTFTLSGKLDAVVRHRDEHLRVGADGQEGWYVCEFKTTGEDLGDFAEAMRLSAQPPLYQELAEASLGVEHGALLGTVLDIIRKPTIRPKKDEPPEDFEQRVLAAYREEPDKFLRRVVLPVNHGLRREVMTSAWRIADGIRRAERYGYMTKRGPACRGAYGPCRFRPLCWYSDRSGLIAKQTAHEELADGE